MSAPPIGSVISTPNDERAGEEHDDRLRRAAARDHEPDAARDRGDEHERIDHVLAAEAERALDEPVELGPGDHAAGERHAADQRADDGEHERRQRRASSPASSSTARDRRRRAAAHAVVERDHLRHVRHRDALAAHPCRAAADRDGGDDQRQVAGRESGHRKVASVATTMPAPAHTMPRRAVTGEPCASGRG